MNFKKKSNALSFLGYEKESLINLSEADFNETVMFDTGIEPFKVDFMNKIAFVNFDEAFKNRINQMVEDDFSIPFININELLLYKTNTERLKDQADIEELQKIYKHKKE